MRFFDEKDFLDYKQFLLTSVHEVVNELSANDETIKVVLIGEFPDCQHRFVTVHPFCERTHIHHPEYDHFASLVLDLAPEGMNMYALGVNGGTVIRTTESD